MSTVSFSVYVPLLALTQIVNQLNMRITLGLKSTFKIINYNVQQVNILEGKQAGTITISCAFSNL